MSAIPDRFAANIAWLFTEHAWLDRFAAARAAGFARVEFPWPDDPGSTAEAVAAAGLAVVLLNVRAGDLEAGERGWPNDPSRIHEFREAFDDALLLARRLDCPVLNVLAGNEIRDVPRGDQLACLEENLRWALDEARPAGVTVVTELLNRRENSAYMLATLDDVALLLERMAPLGWKLQLDTWHLGLSEPDVPAAIRRAGAHIGHVQVADVPGRHEPGTGTLDWAGIGSALAAVGYDGVIGLEYRPTTDPEWIRTSPLAG